MAQSLCEQFGHFPEHHFIFVISSFINDSIIEYGSNSEVFKYDIGRTWRTILLGRDKYLDNLVAEKKVNAVLTIFGPSIWCPRVPHLCGFARAQLLLKDSPYYKKHTSLKERFLLFVWKWSFKRCSKVFYTENEYISNLLQKYYTNKIKVYTVSNYYNQVFDQPDKWVRNKKLTEFDGVTCLSVSSPYPHKNLAIIEGVVRYLRKKDVKFNIRFVLTCTEEQCPFEEDIKQNVLYVGTVDVSECPFLYEQSDIMFMPSLLECFTATYPEAMRMGIPIVTTDLAFAKGLCGPAACYYSADDPAAAAEAIHKVYEEKEYAQQLVDNGKKQLLTFDTYEKRAEKLIKILEEIIGDVADNN